MAKRTFHMDTWYLDENVLLPSKLNKSSDDWEISISLNVESGPFPTTPRQDLVPNQDLLHSAYPV